MHDYYSLDLFVATENKDKPCIGLCYYKKLLALEEAGDAADDMDMDELEVSVEEDEEAWQAADAAAAERRLS